MIFIILYHFLFVISLGLSLDCLYPKMINIDVMNFSESYLKDVIVSFDVQCTYITT